MFILPYFSVEIVLNLSVIVALLSEFYLSLLELCFIIGKLFDISLILFNDYVQFLLVFHFFICNCVSLRSFCFFQSF